MTDTTADTLPITDSSAAPAFDAERRQLSDVVRDWSALIDQQGFLDWLRTHLNWPYHAHTLKLLWYLELGVAAATHNEQVDCRFLAALRDALNSAPTRAL